MAVATVLFARKKFQIAFRYSYAALPVHRCPSISSSELERSDTKRDLSATTHLPAQTMMSTIDDLLPESNMAQQRREAKLKA